MLTENLPFEPDAVRTAVGKSERSLFFNDIPRVILKRKGMEITLNNSISEIAENSSLHELIALQLGEKTNGVAIAVNQNVIPKAEWNDTILQPNDSILIIKATQGG